MSMFMYIQCVVKPFGILLYADTFMSRSNATLNTHSSVDVLTHTLDISSQGFVVLPEGTIGVPDTSAV